MNPVWRDRLIAVACAALAAWLGWQTGEGAFAWLALAALIGLSLGLRDFGGSQAPFNSFLNIIGLETLLPICVKSLIEPGHLGWPELIAKLSAGPAQVLNIDKGTLQAGAAAPVALAICSNFSSACLSAASTIA